MKIIAEIPARAGSQRVKNKNLRFLNNKPMISYTIHAARKSKLINDVYVNTEDDTIGKCAIEYGAKFYKRSKELASDSAKQEEFNYDFIKGTNADILVMINPVCPLIDEDDIDSAIQYYLDNDYDTLITTHDIKLQSFYEGKPININTEEILQPTQSLNPVRVCTWAITIWRASVFNKCYKDNGYASFSGKLGFFKIDPLKAIKVSYEEDFILAESIIKSKDNKTEIQYYS